MIGVWFIECVWEFVVVLVLVIIGICYVMVDDYYFFCIGKLVVEFDGYFSIEEDGVCFDFFLIFEVLCYWLFFLLVYEVIGYFE